VPDLLKLAQERSAKGERTIVTTLTKRLSEDLASYLSAQGLKCRYMHSEIETLDRVEILKDLRVGEYDVLVGVNLLREGLDLPEVSLVAIMDADKAGFLRSPTSLIQQIGRAARNLNGSVILYADAVTPAMAQAMQESSRRRIKQLAFNQEHGITPYTVQKAIRHGIELELKANRTQRAALRAEPKEFERAEIIADYEKQMLEAAQNLDFEKAAQLRDRVKQIKDTPDIGGKIRIDDGDEEDDNKPKPGTPGTRPSKKRRPKRSV
jgi:excinuclease ABC subunit B